MWVSVFSKDPWVPLYKFSHPLPSLPASITAKFHPSIISLIEESICLTGQSPRGTAWAKCSVTASQGARSSKRDCGLCRLQWWGWLSQGEAGQAEPSVQAGLGVAVGEPRVYSIDQNTRSAFTTRGKFTVRRNQWSEQLMMRLEMSLFPSRSNHFPGIVTGTFWLSGLQNSKFCLHPLELFRTPLKEVGTWVSAPEPLPGAHCEMLEEARSETCGNPWKWASSSPSGSRRKAERAARGTEIRWMWRQPRARQT